MSSTTDPKYTPPAAALATVGLTAAQLKSSDAVFNLIVATQVDINAHENQISVLITTLVLRGFTTTELIKRTGYSEASITRKNIEGTAILRTQEVTRTTSAIRSVNMSNKIMEQATRGGTAEQKISALELGAMDRTLASGFTYKDDKTITAEDSALILVATRDAVLKDALPLLASNYIAYVPLLAEQFGIKAKPKAQRTPDPEGGLNTPMDLAYHLKKAQSDMQEIAKAAELPYLPTPQDYYALMQLCEAIGVGLMMDDEVLAGVHALMN